MELHNHIKAISAVDIARETGNTAHEGNWIDTQGYKSLEFLIKATIPDSDATLTPLVEGSDAEAGSHSDKVAILDADLLGTVAGATYAAGDDQKVKKLGLRGLSHRWYRLTLTPAANSGNLDLNAEAVLGHPDALPQATQSN